MLPPFRQMKFEAKIAMMQRMPFWIKATVLLIVLQFAADFAINQLGGFLGRPLIGAVEGYAGLETGFTRQGDQLLILIRLDVLGLLLGVAGSLEAIWRYLLFGGLALLLLAPFKMGVLELYWKAFRNQETRFVEIFGWYKSPARMLKAVVVQFVVGAGSRILAAITLAPGYFLYYLTFSGTFISAEQSGLMTVMSILAMTVLFVGMLAGFFCYATLAPLAYCLAAQPNYSLGEVFRKGFGSIRGFVKRFFYFRLSLLPWHIISAMTYGVAELYIFPYVTFSSLQFLQAAAVERKNQEAAPPPAPQYE